MLYSFKLGFRVDNGSYSLNALQQLSEHSAIVSIKRPGYIDVAFSVASCSYPSAYKLALAIVKDLIPNVVLISRIRMVNYDCPVHCYNPPMG